MLPTISLTQISLFASSKRVPCPYFLNLVFNDSGETHYIRLTHAVPGPDLSPCKHDLLSVQNQIMSTRGPLFPPLL